MKKITIITTVRHNVGDDFVREGLKYLLKQKFGQEELKFSYIHKHSPITSRYGFEWFRDIRYSRRIDPVLPLFLTKDKILEADFIVQSGAPVYWCHDSANSHCANNEWYEPLIKRRFCKNNKAKFLNIAAGTCQSYDSDGKEFVACAKDAPYIKELFAQSSVTTLRDTLAQKVLSSIGLKAPVIPCSSIFAIDEYTIKNSGDDFIAINYMNGGSHHTFGQKIEVEKWRNEFIRFYNIIKKQNKVVFACHNKQEVLEAQSIDSNADIFYSERFIDYMNFYSRARMGILNRVHGAFMLASMGKPAIVIGNDSRAKMVSEIGLSSYFVNDVDTELLMSEVARLESELPTYPEKFHAIKRKAFTDYMEALEPIL